MALPRLYLALALLAAACSSGDDPAAAPPATPTGPTTTPDGGADAGGAEAGVPPGPPVTTIRVHYTSSTPGASGAMTLRGSGGPLSWDTGAPFATTSPGLYTWSSPEVKTDLEMKPMLGENWSRGPNYRIEPGQTVDLYPHFLVSHGTVTKKYPSFTSQQLPSTRGVWVYLPPTYLENESSKLAVLYMHDAQNLFSPSTAFGGVEWQVDETMDAGSEDGSIRETVVVGIENTPDRIPELTPTPDPDYGGGKADAYLSMIIDELKPVIDKDLRTLPGRDTTGIMGSSLGGLVSSYAGVRRADVFGLVGAMSPSTWWDGKVILGEVSSTPTRPSRPLRVYVDSGDSGASNDGKADTAELASRYRSVGYVDGKDLHYVVQAGATHTEQYWAERLPAALRYLLGPRPD